MSEVESQEAEDGLALVEVHRLRLWAQILRSVVDEARVEIGSNSIRARATDVANVAYIDITLRKPAATFSTAEDAVVGVTLDNLHDLLSAFGQETAEISVSGSETPDLCLETDHSMASLSTIKEGMVREAPDLKIDPDESVSLSGRRFLAGLELIDAYDTNTVAIELDGESDSLEVSPGESEYTASATFGEPDIHGLPFEDAQSIFRLVYLTELLKAAGFDEKRDSLVDLELQTEYPLRLSFEPADGLQVEYYQAPRLTSGGSGE